jgi:hypothetical protein
MDFKAMSSSTGLTGISYRLPTAALGEPEHVCQALVKLREMLYKNKIKPAEITSEQWESDMLLFWQRITNETRSLHVRYVQAILRDINKRGIRYIIQREKIDCYLKGFALLLHAVEETSELQPPSLQQPKKAGMTELEFFMVRILILYQ